MTARAQDAKASDLSAIVGPVRRAEHRIRAARALRVFARALVVGLALSIVVVALRKLGVVSEPHARGLLAILGGGSLVAAGVAYLYRIAPNAGAVALDRHHGLADRLSSALDFAARKRSDRTDFMQATIADAIAHAGGVDPKRAVPIPMPRDLAVAAGFAALLASVMLFEVRRHEVVAAAKTIDALEVTPDDLDAVREFLRDMEQRPLSDDTKAAINEFNQLVEDLAQKRLDRTEAFRKLQSLEEKLLNGRDANAKDLEEALAKMGEELKKSEATKPAGEALTNKNLAEASEKLKELAKKLKEEGGKFDKAQLEKMRDALKKAAESQDARKAALDKRRDELQKDLLKQKEKLANKENPSEEEKNLLKKKERELERLEREREQQEQTGRQLDRLDRELAQAAEDLMKELGASADDLEKGAEDINRMSKEQMTDKEKEELRQRLQELRETLRRQGKGGKQQMSRLQKFQRRARGGGKGQAGKGAQEGEQNGTGEQGQGQEGQGQEGQEGQEGQNGQGQNGQGQQPGQNGEMWVMGPNGQKMLVLSRGQGSQSGGGADRPSSGAGHERGGNPQGAATQLKGQMQDTQVAGQDTGEGSSNSEVILGAAERGFASRGYTKVYRDYKTVAEEALSHDDIPGGYRFYVRRYFLLIRPRENP